jgi:ABC-type nickel/cobalt efflux system permease component RcnA
MRQRVAAALALGLTLVAGAAGANPWAGRGTETPPSEAPPPARRQPAESVGAVPAPLRPAVAWIVAAQRGLNQTVAREMRTLRESPSAGALLTITAIAFLWGILHAAGPGHGKLVISSYFLGRHARPLRGVLVGAAISFLQVLTAVVVVGGGALVLGASGFTAMEHGTRLELLSYALIVLLGLYLAFSVLTGRHAHAESPGGERRVGAGLIIAAGLTPCASAVLLLLFALGNHVFVVGVLASLVMAVGMSLTVSLVGVTTILARRAMLLAVARRPAAARWLATGLSLTGAVLIITIGSLFLASAWSRL